MEHDSFEVCRRMTDLRAARVERGEIDVRKSVRRLGQSTQVAGRDHQVVVLPGQVVERADVAGNEGPRHGHLRVEVQLSPRSQ